MSSAGKRLDLRFGSFACSVRGFDDPVPPVQQILRAIQHLLEESPELSDTAINFDAEAIEQLVGEVARRAELDEDAVEIVPGLIIIHHEGSGDLAGRGDAAADYVSLFGASGGEATAESDEAPDEVPAKFTERLRRTADEAPAGNGTDYGWDDAGDAAGDGGAGDHFLTPGGAPADETRADDAWQADDAGDDPGNDPGDDAADAGPLNLFADASGDDAGEARGEVRNLFAADSGEDGDEDGDALVLGRAGAGEAAPPDAEGAEGEDGYTAASLAERAEARKVPELMVSAAAFMVLIRGQGRFTRRDVLDVFETIPGDHEKTLEAQIKGFGKAVRNGQLVMIEDGVFGLSQSELDRFQQLL